MELLLALVLFIGLIVCWLMLPGTSTSAEVVHTIEQREMNVVSSATVQQAA